MDYGFSLDADVGADYRTYSGYIFQEVFIYDPFFKQLRGLLNTEQT
jgi:hypothetical protein